MKPKRLEHYVKNLFIERNNIEPELSPGINYDEETLSYMTPGHVADQITKAMLTNLTDIRPVLANSVVVYECCAGIGGNSLSFLSSSEIKKLVSYEINESRRTMLQNNLKAYGLPNGKEFDLRAEYNGINEEERDSILSDPSLYVLYFDPPWLPPDIPGHTSTKSQYYSKGIKVGGRTVEDWIEQAFSSGFSLVTVRFPLFYQVEERRNVYRFDIVDYPKSRMVFFRPVPNDSVLSEYLSRFLDKVDIPGKKPILTDETFPIFRQAFVHSTYDPNDNYERLEKLGDGISKACFIDYIYRSYETASPALISDLCIFYMSKMQQQRLSSELGFDKFIRTRDCPNTVSILEDVFESFFGAVFTSGEKYASGRGYTACFAIIRHIFDGKDIDMTRVYGSNKTIVLQSLARFGQKEPIISKEKQAKEDSFGFIYRYRIEATKDTIEFFISNGLNIVNPLGIGVGNSEKAAEVKAYEEAWNQFHKAGLTADFFDIVRREKDLLDPQLSEHIDRLMAKAKREGYEDLEFVTPKGGETLTGTTCQLLGRKTDSLWYVLSSKRFLPNPETKRKKELVELYLST